MFKSLPKSKYPSGMLYFLTEHTLTIYVQYIKGSKRKTSYRLQKLFKKDLVHFVSDSILKRLEFDYSSSETVSNQKIKIKNFFLDDCVLLEFRLTYGNQLLPNEKRKTNEERHFQICLKKHETPLVYFLSDDLENEETVFVSRKFNDFVVRPILKVTVSYNVKIVQATENHAFLS